MSKFNPHVEAAPVLNAARRWFESCWVRDGSVIFEGNLWTPPNLSELHEKFVNAPDTSDKSFAEKLQGQMSSASQECRKLMSEALWILILFQSNIGAERKRETIGGPLLSATKLPLNHPMLSDAVLAGLGNPGVAYNTGRPRELAFLINASLAFKALSQEERQKLAGEPWEFSKWVSSIQDAGYRQFRHMLRHFVFPELFERITVGSDKRDILAAFEKQPAAYYKKLPSEEIDRRLLALRERLEKQFGTPQIDFYDDKLHGQWKRKSHHDDEPHRSWLLSWNPKHWAWQDLPAAIAKSKNGEKVRERWSCSSKQPIVGDSAWLARVGEKAVVMARGVVARASYEDAHWDSTRAAAGETTNFIEVDFDEIRNPDEGDAVPVSALSEVAPDQHWSPQNSGIEISAKAGKALIDLWDASEDTDADKDLPPLGESEPLNLILYGPPGTGKTHEIQQLRAKYTDRAQEADRLTWAHELVGRYGWRPVIVVAMAAIGGDASVGDILRHSIVKAKAAQRGRSLTNLHTTVYNYLREHCAKGDEAFNTQKRPPLVAIMRADGKWGLTTTWKTEDEEAAELFVTWQAGPTASREAAKRYRFVTFHPSFGYEDFIQGIRPISEEGEPVQFRLVDGVFKQVCEEARANPGRRYAVFIDEINRGNIAKIFGELITLVETNKRARYDKTGMLVSGLEVQLPGGAPDEPERLFGVPTNLDIYGTMNTADRSIASLDVALRRRFKFRELEPEYQLFESAVFGVELGRLLKAINDRLEYLIDRDHRIGHAYFMSVRSLDDLRSVFATQIIPLLREYFFDDLDRIALVLANGKSSPFVHREILPKVGRVIGAGQEKYRFIITPSATWSAASFQRLYSAELVEAEEEPA